MIMIQIYRELISYLTNKVEKRMSMKTARCETEISVIILEYELNAKSHNPNLTN